MPDHEKSKPANIPGALTSKRKKTTFWFAGIFFVILIAGYFFQSYLYITYYCIFKLPHFNKGDKVYVSQTYIDKKNLSALITLQLIRPLTTKDWDGLNQSDKQVLKINSQPNSRTIAALAGSFISLDSLRKHQTRYVGTFLKYDIVYVKDTSGKHNVAVIQCAIKPAIESFIKAKDNHFFIRNDNLIADSTQYVNPFQI